MERIENSNEFKSEILGNNIKNIRKNADLTQEEFSEKLGVTPQFLSAVERGLSGISINTAINICKIVNCSPAVLFKNIINYEIKDISNLYEQLDSRDQIVVQDLIKSLLKNS